MMIIYTGTIVSFVQAHDLNESLPKCMFLNVECILKEREVSYFRLAI